MKLQANGADGGEVEDELPEHEEDQEGDEGEDEVYEEPDELGLDGENEEQVEEVAAEISRSREVSGVSVCLTFLPT